MSTAYNHVDVGLGGTVHDVEVVAAGGLLNEEINSICIGSSGIHVVAVHTTLDVVVSSILTLIHSELVCSAGNGLNCAGVSRGSVRSSGSLGSNGALTCNKSNDPAVLYLRSAAVLTNDTVNGNGVTYNRLLGKSVVTGSAVSRVSAVNGEDVALSVSDLHVTVLGVVNLGDNTGNKVLVLGVGVVLLGLTESDRILNGGSGSDRLYPSVLELNGVIVLTDYGENNDVVANYGLGGHCVVSGCAVSAVKTVDVNLVAIAVNDVHITVNVACDLGDNACYKILVGSEGVVLLSRTDGDNLGDRSSGLVKSESVGLGRGSLAASCVKSKGYGELLVGNGNGNLTVSCDSNCCVVRGPGELNSIVGSTCERKSELAVSVEVGGNLNVANLKLNLLCIATLGKTEVLEAINRGGDEVRRGLVVEYENTGYVCEIAELLCVSGIHSCLISLAERIGKVGEVGSEVRGVVANSEVEILAVSVVKILCADLNALDGYGESNVLLKVLVNVLAGNNLGDVNGSVGLDGGIDDLSGTALDLLHSAVGLDRTGNCNGHTNLDTKISDGVLIHLVGVVTALTACISKEEVVSLRAGGLGVDRNYDTLNEYGVALSGCHIVVPTVDLVLRNIVLEVLGLGVAVCIGNGSGEHILKRLVSLRHADGNGAVTVVGDGDLVVVYAPSNGEVLAVNGRKLGNANKACGGRCRLVLIHVEEISNCCIDRSLAIVVVFAAIAAYTSGKSAETKNESKNESQNLFHFFGSPFILFF